MRGGMEQRGRFSVFGGGQRCAGAGRGGGELGDGLLCAGDLGLREEGFGGGGKMAAGFLGEILPSDVVGQVPGGGLGGGLVDLAGAEVIQEPGEAGVGGRGREGGELIGNAGVRRFLAEFEADGGDL